MSLIFPECPAPPEWRLDWESLERSQPWLLDLGDCPQNPEYHAEGDVRQHTRLACQSLVASPAWRSRAEPERAVLFAAVLLHDIGKLGSTRLDEAGRISSPGHAGRGEVMARRLLWRMGVPIEPREQVAALVRHHQKPFYLLENPNSQRLALEISQSARCDLLGLVAEADARGRICQDLDRLVDNVALFVEFCREQGCLDRPYTFLSDHSRFRYFRSAARDPEYLAYDDTRCEVVVMSGLPGAGKDHWVHAQRADWPLVSLDALRQELGVSPTDAQGQVIAVAREQARTHLRAGRSFVWSGTNLSRELRSRVIQLLADYQARVRIVYVEVPEAQLRRQNRERPSPVPEPVLERLMSRWQVPDLTEAYQVAWIAEG